MPAMYAHCQPSINIIQCAITSNENQAFKCEISKQTPLPEVTLYCYNNQFMLSVANLGAE